MSQSFTFLILSAALLLAHTSTARLVSLLSEMPFDLLFPLLGMLPAQPADLPGSLPDPLHFLTQYCVLREPWQNPRFK